MSLYLYVIHSYIKIFTILFFYLFIFIYQQGMPGATHLRDSTDLKELLQHQKSKGKFIAAICAAPAVVLQSHGLLEGKAATCYPVPKFTDSLALYRSDRVCVDGNVITSQGPATSLEFSLKLVEVLFGKKKADDVGAEMLFVH